MCPLPLPCPGGEDNLPLTICEKEGEVGEPGDRPRGERGAELCTMDTAGMGIIWELVAV